MKRKVMPAPAANASVARPARFAVIPVVALAAAAVLSAGCSHPAPVTMAPPIQAAPPPMSAPAGAMNGGGGGMAQPAGAANGVYNWQDVPVGQQVPVTRAVFDQGGYQIFCQTGETIVIPFVNQNLYAMKFGQSNNGGMYFVNDGSAPTLYVPSGGYLENAAASGARWYPFSQGFQYTQPVYIGLAPTWNDFVGMGWYPGMSYWGGYWGYHPWRFGGVAYSPMPGLVFHIGGVPYYGWNSYSSYYYAHPYNRVYVRSAPTFRYNSVGRQASSSFGRSSFGGTRTTGSFGRSSGSTGSFGRSPSTFGRSTGTTGSFGRSSSTGSFGTSASRPSGSFGSGTSSGYSPFGRRSSGSFGGGTSGFGSSSGGGSFGRSSGSFGGGRSSGFGSFGGGSTFGGSRSTFGGGSFGGSRSSFGGGSFGGGRSSFGGGRRR